MATILLLGLEDDLAEPLAVILRRLSHDVLITNSLSAALSDRYARIVFAGGDGPGYRSIVRNMTATRPDTAVILVNRFPENARWLDALELGATDYCGAPFEPAQISWVVDGALNGLERVAA